MLVLSSFSYFYSFQDTSPWDCTAHGKGISSHLNLTVLIKPHRRADVYLKLNLKPVKLSVYVNNHTSIHFRLCAIALTISSYPSGHQFIIYAHNREKKVIQPFLINFWTCELLSIVCVPYPIAN